MSSKSARALRGVSRLRPRYRRDVQPGKLRFKALRQVAGKTDSLAGVRAIVDHHQQILVRHYPLLPASSFKYRKQLAHRLECTSI
jgi:hypothetical protein